MLVLAQSNLALGNNDSKQWDRPWPPRQGQADLRHIEIGLVNNMPDSALLATERQFMSLVRRGAEGRPVRMHLFSLPSVPRSAEARERMEGFYHDIESLSNWPLDALIVTGTEPKAADLADEPYWQEFGWLVDWAARNTVSTIWSCLAAHAAVQHLGGPRRKPMPAKCSGVFDCNIYADDALLTGFARPLKVAHSRWNRLEPAELSQAGYRILTRSQDAGADIFTRNAGSNFVFLQGHPEYDVTSLMREYRRDVTRFLSGEGDRYPDIPAGYFPPETEDELRRLRQLAEEDRASVQVRDLPCLDPRPELAAEMAQTGSRLFRNWFDLIAANAGNMRPALKQGTDNG